MLSSQIIQHNLYLYSSSTTSYYRDVLTKKDAKAFKNDSELDAASIAFIQERLNIVAESEWPLLRDISESAPPSSSAVATSDEEPHRERMAIFMKLSGDEGFSNSLEVKCPRNYKGLGISMSSFRPKPLLKDAIKKKEAAAAVIEVPVASNSTETLVVTDGGVDDATKKAINDDSSKKDSDAMGNEPTDASNSGDKIELVASAPTGVKGRNIDSKTQPNAAKTTPNPSPNKKLPVGSGAAAVKAVRVKK